jgi:hypothetical protein
MPQQRTSVGVLRASLDPSLDDAAVYSCYCWHVTPCLYTITCQAYVWQEIQQQWHNDSPTPLLLEMMPCATSSRRMLRFATRVITSSTPMRRNTMARDPIVCAAVASMPKMRLRRAFNHRKNYKEVMWDYVVLG